MHVLDSEDPQEWANKISEIRAKEPTQLALEAKQLQEEYMRDIAGKNNVINL